MDELNIRTNVGMAIVERVIKNLIKKKLKRKIGICIHNLSVTHGTKDGVSVSINAVATMSEAELLALVEQLGGDK